MADTDTDTNIDSDTATDTAPNVINGVAYVVAPATPPRDQVLEDYEKDSEQLDQDMDKVSELMYELAKRGNEIQKWDQEKRKVAIDKITSDIRKIGDSKAILSDLAVKAKNTEELDKNQGGIIGFCIKEPSFESQRTSLQETLDQWFDQFVDHGKLEDLYQYLFPSGVTLSIYEENRKFFDPKTRDWEMIASILDNEVAMRSIIQDKLQTKLAALEPKAFIEDWFPSQPNASQLKSLEIKLQMMAKQKEELQQRIAQRQAQMVSAAGPVQPTPQGQPGQPVTPGPTGSGQENMAQEMSKRDQLLLRYVDILAARDPSLTSEEVKSRASLMVDKLLERREKLVGNWVDKMTRSNPGVDQKAAREYAERLVDHQMAENEAAALAKGGSPATGKEMVMVSQRPQVHEVKQPLKGELTPAQRQSREMLVQRAEMNRGNYSLREMVRHPTIPINLAIGFVKNYFKKFFEKGAKEGATVDWQGSRNSAAGLLQKGTEKVAEKTVEKVAEKTAKKVAGNTIGLAVKGVLALLPTGVGQAIAAVLAAKDVAVGVLKKVIPKEMQEKLADIWSKVKIGLAGVAAFIIAHPLALVFGTLGVIVGGPVGFIAGFAVGLVAQGIIAQALGLSGSIGSGIGAGVSSFGAGLGSFAGSIVSGAGATVTGIAGLANGAGLATVAFWSVAIAVPSLGLLAFILGVGSVAAISAENVQGQTRQALFSLTKGADNTSFPDYNGDLTTVRYTITVKPTGSNPITIVSIKDKLSRAKGAATVVVGNVNVPTPTEEIPVDSSKDVSYQFSFSGSEYMQSTLLNLVTVVAKDSTTGDEETQTASIGIRIASPPTQQPYGYPAEGAVTSLDLDAGVDSNGVSQTHWSCFFIFSPCRVDGGIDIAGLGGTPVKSTMEGTVIYAEFRPLDVGGVVYIQSDDKTYVTEYEHLDSNLQVHTGQTGITRGQQIGVTYTGPLPTTRGVHPEHVHYQVTLNGANVFFTDPNNIGSCADGKILPGIPGNTVTEGPFNCD